MPARTRTFARSADKVWRGITAPPSAEAHHSEMRAVQMVPAGKSETIVRYADAIELVAQLHLIANIPLLKAGVERRSIKLVPWVARGAIAPRSTAAVAVRRETATSARRKPKAPKPRRP